VDVELFLYLLFKIYCPNVLYFHFIYRKFLNSWTLYKNSIKQMDFLLDILLREQVLPHLEVWIHGGFET